jgi:hypothetical protein
VRSRRRVRGDPDTESRRCGSSSVSPAMFVGCLRTNGPCGLEHGQKKVGAPADVLGPEPLGSIGDLEAAIGSWDYRSDAIAQHPERVKEHIGSVEVFRRRA